MGAAGGEAVHFAAALDAAVIVGHGDILQHVGLIQSQRLLSRGVIPRQPPIIEGRDHSRRCGRFRGGCLGRDHQRHAGDQGGEDQRQNGVQLPSPGGALGLTGSAVCLSSAFRCGCQFHGITVLLGQPSDLQGVHIGPELGNLPMQFFTSLAHATIPLFFVVVGSGK